MRKVAPLATLLHNRGAFVQVLASAALLALGINLFAAALFSALAGHSSVLWFLAICVLVLSVCVIARLAIPSRHISRKLEGFVVFRRDSSDLIPVPRYHFAEELGSFLTGLFAENEAPKKLFESDPVHKAFDVDRKTGTGRIRQTEAGKLIVEATEYYVLETLSTHLTDYFNQSELDSARLKEFSREDVADIVFKNRFLDTFSRPMRERAAFVRDSPKTSNHMDRVVAFYGSNGVRYSKFDLVLPIGARIERRSPTSICIETPKFRLVFEINFIGVNANLPRSFPELYLGCTSHFKANAYAIGISTDVEFKPRSLLSRSGWEYHAWIDSLLSQLEFEFSREAFFETIHWESALTVSRIVERTVIRQRESESTDRQPDTANNG